MRAHRLGTLALLALAVAACADDAPKAEPTAAKAPAAEGAMCEEHGVLEAVCTKCNPKLIPVFQAKGDWCEEHGFPESICPICHPERGGKPAGDVSAESGAPADGTKVRFKGKDTARLAGIEVVKATERSAESGIVATARIAYDATRVAIVNARSPGVVETLDVEIGAQVKKGARLATIRSAAVGADQSRLTAARVRVETAEKAYRREEDLAARGIAAKKDAEAAREHWENAKAELAALQANLGVVGAPGARGTYVVTAPIAGVVTQRNVTVGNSVEVEDTIFQIVDASAMWAEVDVAEPDVPLVKAGQRVSLTLDSVPERQFDGTITYVAPEIDARTRTAMARVPLANPDGLLRANMFGQARIAVGEARAAVTVPRAAVQRAKDVSLVFVRITPDEYEARRVQVGATEGDAVTIAKGVKPGEEVVTTGSFLLKTETLKESIGAGCCD